MIDLKVMPIDRASNYGRLYVDPISYEHHVKNKSGFYSYRTPSKQEVGEYALKELETAWAKDKAIHEANIPAIENNKAIVSHIKETMKSFGITETYRAPDPKSRARYPKDITHYAGYVNDITRCIKVTDSYIESQYVYLKDRYEKFIESGKQEDAKLAAQKAAAERAEKEARKSNLAMAKIIIRYKLDPDNDWDWNEIFEELCSRNSRLNLAFALLNNRNDWTEGYSYAESGLNSFKIENEQDQEIYDAVSAAISSGDDGDIDGRIFRDMHWSYDSIFASIEDQQLVEDADLAHSMIQDY